MQTTDPQTAKSDLLATRYPLPATRHVSTFNALHLGDNLIHLHFMRAMAKAYPDVTFTHGAPDQHLAQLYPLWQDLPNLTVKSIAEVGQGSINAWRGAGGHWYAHPQRNDFVAYHLDWFRHLARLMGLESPIHCARDMLFDYPALKCEYAAEPIKRILIINCPPLSGQWQGYNPEQMNRLAADLWAAGHAVLSVMPTGHPEITSTIEKKLDVTAIGRLSINAECIIGCVTGPMWPCLNVWGGARPLRVHLLDSENVTFCANTVHANATSLVPEILKSHGYL